MDRPELTQRQQQIMMLIGKKKPDECDAIEKHVRKKGAELSFKIEQASGQLSNMKEQVAQLEKDIQIYIGKFLATAELAEEHSMEKMKEASENAPKCSGCGAPFPGDPAMLDGSDAILCGACSEKKNAEDAADPGQPDPPAEEEHPQSSADQPEEGASA